MCGYRPTTHHKCKEEPYKNIVGRQQHPLTNVGFGGQPKRISKRLPSKLGAALLQSPDAIYKLIKHKRKQTLSPSHSHRPSRSSFHNYSGHIIKQPFRRQSKRATYSHLSRLSTRSTIDARRWTSSSATQIASPIGMNQQNMVIDDHHLRKGSKSMALESVMAKWGSPKGSMEVKARADIQELGGPIAPPHCGVSHSRRHSKSWPFLKEMDEIGDSCIETPRSSTIQLYVRDANGTRRRRKQKYTLRSFLKEFEKKEQTQKQLEFLGKGHHLWQMGMMGEGIMPAVVGEKDAYYKQQFHNWAQYVINRERNLLSFNVIANTTINAPSFIPGLASEVVMKLQQGKLQKHVDHQQGKPSKLSHSNNKVK
jgi:hypothetical protein